MGRRVRQPLRPPRDALRYGDGHARHRASLPVGVNPWSVEPFIVTSIDYIKRPEVLPAVRACRWDVVDRGRGASCRHRNGSPRRGPRAVQQRAVRGAADRDTAQRRSAGIHVAVRNSVSTTTRSWCFAGLVNRSATLACAEFTNCASDPARKSARCTRPWTRFVRAVHREPDGRAQSDMAGLGDAAKARAVERLRPAAIRRTSAAAR